MSLPLKVPFQINPHFYQSFISKKKYKIFYGGRGGGKSHFIAQAFILKLLGSDYFRGIIARAVFSDIRGSQFQELTDIIEDSNISHLFIIRKNIMEIECKETGNKIIAKGLRKDSANRTAKVKSIKDPTDVWIEEADEVGKEDFTKMVTSLRTVKSDTIHVWLSFNPENEDHWIRKRWFNEDYSHKEDEDSIINHSTYKINLYNLQTSYIRELENLQHNDPEWAKVYVDGKWGGGKRGRVFPEFKIISESFFDSLDCYDNYGVDWGYNDPTVLMHVKFFDGQLYLKQLYYERERTIDHFLSHIKTLNITSSDQIFCDTNRTDHINTLQQHGYNAQYANKDSVLNRVGFMKRIPINIVDTSKEAIKEFKKYVWHIDPKTDRPLDKPVKLDDHTCDAAGYGCYSDYNLRMHIEAA